VKISRLNIQSVQHDIPKGAPFDANEFNDLSAETSTDFASLASQWNTLLLPLCSASPDGSSDSLINAYKNGLDGSTMYVDSRANTSADKLRYYNEIRKRPKTIKEMIDELISGEFTSGPGSTAGSGSTATTHSITLTAFPTFTAITNSTASHTTADAQFPINFDQFSSTIDIRLSIIGKINAAPYAGGVSAWTSSTVGGLGDNLLSVIELPTAGTGGNFVAFEDEVVSLANPGGLKYVVITSFAGATSPESDVGAITLNYRGLVLTISNHV
jgi:hypothetical protein